MASIYALQLKQQIRRAGNDTLEAITSQLLLSQGLTLAVAESFTGGFLAYSLANAPDSQRFLRGGIIAIDEETRAELNIMPNSPAKADVQSATCMAALARNKFDSDIGIGIDGFIEPKNDNPVGKAFIAINLKQSEHSIVQTYPWRPNLLVRRSVMQAIFNLRKALLTV